MVTTSEVGQLSGECNLWIDTLRSFRKKLNNQKTILPDIAANQMQRDILLEVEHLDNQLHIQLINIHDLKQSIKRHMQKIMFERANNKGQISDDSIAKHEYLYDEYQRLETTLHIISREFDRFVRHVRG
jgi:hypothetical protein